MTLLLWLPVYCIPAAFILSFEALLLPQSWRFLFPSELDFLPFFFFCYLQDIPFKAVKSYSHLPPMNLLACRCLHLLLLLFLAFIASAQGRMRERCSSHGNLLSPLVFQQRVRSVINLSFHLHVQQRGEEGVQEWDWFFINIVRKRDEPCAPPLSPPFFNLTPSEWTLHWSAWSQRRRGGAGY